MMTQITHILHVLKRDKNKAYRMIYDDYFERLYAAGARYIVDKHELEEVIHDAFIKIFNNIDKAHFLHDAAFYLWAKKILINECLMRLKQKKIIYEEIENIEVESSADHNLLAKFSAQEIIKAIQNLPSGYKIVFNLYEIENWTHKEIAAVLDISESTSKSQLFKAKKQLKTSLSDLYHG